MFGRTYPEGWGLVGAVSVFIGFFLTFFPQFLLGNAGMPRRYYFYDARFTTLHVTSTVGAFVLAAGLLVTLIYLVGALVLGARASGNPWHAAGYEWRTPSPPPPHNFVGLPDLSGDHYDYASDREVREP
jgi:cytochrome c oxidase subunit 1